jgi:hypothetical protein
MLTTDEDASILEDDGFIIVRNDFKTIDSSRVKRSIGNFHLFFKFFPQLFSDFKDFDDFFRIIGGWVIR